jgi:hypothetical protein
MDGNEDKFTRLITVVETSVYFFALAEMPAPLVAQMCQLCTAF